MVPIVRCELKELGWEDELEDTACAISTKGTFLLAARTTSHCDQSREAVKFPPIRLPNSWLLAI